MRGAARGAHQQILGHRVLHAVSSKGGEFTRKMPFVYNYNCMAILIIIANAVRDVFWDTLGDRRGDTPCRVAIWG